MPQHTTPRQPLRCENCRKRKIKCQSGQVPCATCVKRGYAQTCYYKRNADVPQHSHPNESELLHRVRNLEDLLKQQIQIAQSSQSPTEPRGCTIAIPTKSNDNSPSPRSKTPSVTTRARQTGTIVTSPAGYQRFVPRSSTLDTSLVHELAESVPSPLFSSNFPFSSDTTSSKKRACGYTASPSAVR
jgi:Fungal Zn(2)-Cys(6) binuclear cluster domain